MNPSKFLCLKNLHLIVALAIVVPFAFIYGISPGDTLPQYFDFQVETTDLKNVFRAIMGLYLTVSAVWILGTIKPHLWKAATILHIVFMLGLAFGRALSMLVDGIPSQAYVTGFVLELILGIYSVFQFRKYGREKVFRSLIAEHKGNTYKIQEDLPDIGWYLFQYDTANQCTHDTLQDNLASAMSYAEEEFGVPLLAWK